MATTILGTRIDTLSKQNVLGRVRSFLNSKEPHFIVTANPEIVMAAKHNDEYRAILNKADLVVADGIGLKFASQYLGSPIPQRLTGVELVYEIADIAEEENASIYLLGAGHGIAEKAARNLTERFPGLTIAGFESGHRFGWWRVPDERIVRHIRRSKAKVLFVAFGHPKQEKWIYYNLPKLPNIRIAMGVGGAFDYIAGKVKRAPVWMQKMGLEWLYRLMREPSRGPRIVTAVFRFSWHVLKSKKAQNQ